MRGCRWIALLDGDSDSWGGGVMQIRIRLKTMQNMKHGIKYYVEINAREPQDVMIRDMFKWEPKIF